MVSIHGLLKGKKGIVYAQSMILCQDVSLSLFLGCRHVVCARVLAGRIAVP